jgi:hypothetical protein
VVSQDTFHLRADIWQHAAGATTVVVDVEVPAVGPRLGDCFPTFSVHFVSEAEFVSGLVLELVVVVRQLGPAIEYFDNASVPAALERATISLAVDSLLD